LYNDDDDNNDDNNNNNNNNNTDVMARKPDIISENKKEIFILTDVAIPVGTDDTQEESEKKLKHKS